MSVIFEDRDRCLENEKFLEKECKFCPQKRSGKGGQKINKASTAIRLEHLPTGLSVIASESRYQAENRKIALKKLKNLIALRFRLPVKFEPIKLLDFVPSLNNPSYYLWLAKLLDILEENEYSLSKSAQQLGCSTGQLVKILLRDDDLWTKVNEERRKRGIKELKSG